MLSLENENSFRAGFIALLGKPNVGKSTLMNTIVGQDISIVSDKAQTTRRRVLGIFTQPEYQMVFIDTPGVHKAHTRLGKLLNEIAQQSVESPDAVCVVVDSSKSPDEEDRAIADMLIDSGWIDRTTRKAKPGVLLCMNKMDRLKAVDVQDHVDAYQTLFGTENMMMTSMTRRDNIDKLLAMLAVMLPESEALYPEDEITDQPMRTMAAEIVREQALLLTRAEVPHALATVVESYDESVSPTRITINIVVEREGQKAILIGKHGQMLKEIGTNARKKIEEFSGNRIFLELYVKVREEWRQNPRMLQELEYLN